MKSWYKCSNIGQQHHCSSVTEKALLVSLFLKPFNNDFLQRDIFATVLSPVLNSSIQATCLLENLIKRNRFISKWTQDYRNAKMTLKLFCSNLRCKDLPLLRFLTVNHCAQSECRDHLCTFFPNKEVCVLFIVI